MCSQYCIIYPITGKLLNHVCHKISNVEINSTKSLHNDIAYLCCSNVMPSLSSMDGVDILLGEVNTLVLVFVGVDTLIGSATSGESRVGTVLVELVSGR